ncbi:MAG: M24 family metallopeptidase [Candidatus Melainabacteria bacterium]
MARKSSAGADKLTTLRTRMKVFGLNALLVPSADEHLNEYLPAHTQRRQWLSGFTGSAGDLLVGEKEAWLFVDSRYHTQVDTEVDRKRILPCKPGLTDQPSLTQQLARLATPPSRKSKSAAQTTVKTAKSKAFTLGVDPYTLSMETARQLQRIAGVTLKPLTANLVDVAWQADKTASRPDPVMNPVKVLPEKYTGLSATEKLANLRARMAERNVTVLPLTKLDQIAWLLNLRGTDIAYNPLFISYAIITVKRALLFTEASRLTAEARDALKAAKVTVSPYDEYAATLAMLSKGRTVWLDPRLTTWGTELVVASVQGRIVEAPNPVEAAKAIKNPTEIRWMQKAHVKAGRAKTGLLKWLKAHETQGVVQSEANVARELERRYAAEKDFQGLSFNTIAGAGANSAIVHYGTPGENALLKTGGWFLVDSGAQYLGGTTDATRTLVMGKPTAEQKRLYTLVLRAHMACAMQIFPEGTTGVMLDAITRSALWQAKLDFGHGTGHGVGAFLNVHEGPAGIHRNAHVPLAPGMITSIEPGYYRPGWGGIRLENLYVVKAVSPGWLGFESLTVIPFEDKLIDAGMLTKEEAAWLKAYAAQVAKALQGRPD